MRPIISRVSAYDSHLRIESFGFDASDLTCNWCIESECMQALVNDKSGSFYRARVMRHAHVDLGNPYIFMISSR
jgi:hypothetical protein